MRKINVITQKELVNSELIRNCTAVVVDVLLATSTITYLLENQYESVYAVKDAKSARKVTDQIQSPYLLMGELDGEPIEGFRYPDPTGIEKIDHQSVAIICSTNGTVAVENAKNAKSLYVSSLLNGHKVANEIALSKDHYSIVIVCSGNAGRFSMEDFIGAGHVIDHLVKHGPYQLSDSARLAREAFCQAKSNHFEALFESETAHLLKNTGYGEATSWVIDQFEQVNVVPILKEDKFIRNF